MHDDLRAAADRYASQFTASSLPIEPARRLAVLTCMDARIDPVKLLGLENGDANVLRNAGALVTEDVLRSLALSHHLLGTQAVVVIGHTNCGLEGASNEELAERLGHSLDYLPFRDVDESVRASVLKLRESALAPNDVSGYVYDVRTGLLRPV
jgi:carbonic anhydrase